jgi:hypothetical protein
VTLEVTAARFLSDEPAAVGPQRPPQRGWTAKRLAQHMLQAQKNPFWPLDRSGDVFSWDPI